MPLPSPAQLTGVPTWPEWRPGQEDAVLAIANWLEAPEPILALTAPAGAGKTLLAAAAAAFARHDGTRTAILTPRKSLQDQMEDDLAAVAATLKGRGAYPCPAAEYQGKSKTAGDAACAGGRSSCWTDPPEDPKTGKKPKGRQIRIEPKDCTVQRAGDCPYYGALKAAKEAQTVVGNYALWQAWQGKEDSPFDDVGLVICDEAHLLQSEMTTGQAIEIHSDGLDIAGLYTPHERAAQTNDFKQRRDDISEAARDIAAWQAWASEIIDLKMIPEDMGTQGEEIAVRELNEACRAIQRLAPAGAVCQVNPQAINEGGFEFGRRNERFTGTVYKILPIAPQLDRMVADPADPDGDAILKTLCLSATIHPIMLGHIGVRGDQHILHEMPPTWDPDRSPVSLFPDAVPMSAEDLKRAGAVQESHDAWLAVIGPRRIDPMLILPNAHRYAHDAVWGIAHHLPQTWNDRMRFNTGSDDLEEVLAAHKRNPGLLASASLGVGFDFPDNQCRSILIPKIPYASLGDELVRARQDALGWAWYNWEAIATLMQMAGRGMRNADDWCQTVITDKGWTRFQRSTRKYQPAWFRQRLAPYMEYAEFRGLWATEPAGEPAPPEMDPGEFGLFVCDTCFCAFPGSERVVAILESEDPWAEKILCDACELFE